MKINGMSHCLALKNANFQLEMFKMLQISLYKFATLRVSMKVGACWILDHAIHRRFFAAW